VLYGAGIDHFSAELVHQNHCCHSSSSRGSLKTYSHLSNYSKDLSGTTAVDDVAVPKLLLAFFTVTNLTLLVHAVHTLIAIISTGSTLISVSCWWANDIQFRRVVDHHNQGHVHVLSVELLMSDQCVTDWWVEGERGRLLCTGMWIDRCTV